MNGNEPPVGPEPPPEHGPERESGRGDSSPREPQPEPRPEAQREPRSEAPYKAHIRSRRTWLRLLYMLVLVLIYGIAEIVGGAVVIAQFLWVLLTGERNEKLRELGQSLAAYAYQIIRYLSFNTELRPFPFDREWPSGAPRDDSPL